jgi:hypothetical protein
MSIAEILQFRILPFGSFLIPVTGVALWCLRKRMTWQAIFFVTTMGIAGGATLVGALRALFLLPLRFGCLDCGLLSAWWYSDAITFVQGFGVTSALALLTHWLALRSRH